ncbi:MAG: serine/threonine protein kinase [Polyangiales bacterium]|jgi:serine/threonine protein kinase
MAELIPLRVPHSSACFSTSDAFAQTLHSAVLPSLTRPEYTIGGEAEVIPLCRFFDLGRPFADVLNMSSDERSELRGTVLDGRYRLGACIGVGGTGVVFEGERLSDGHSIVVKTLRPVYAGHPDLGRRLRREVEVARNVHHPAVVNVLDEGTLDDATPYLVMERIRGEAMNRLLRRMGTLGVAETLIIALRVADVLHTAHAQGYIHRDVKPEHIILDRDLKGDLRVYLLDFGVCASDTAPEDERRRERGRVFGTPSYVSPEQASGDPDVDGRADIFGLGIVVFEALAGRMPFSGSTVTNLLRRIIREDAPRVGLVCPRVSRDLDAVIARMLARDKSYRFPNARALSRALAMYVPERARIERSLAAQLHVGKRQAESVPTVEHTAA